MFAFWQVNLSKSFGIILYLGEGILHHTASLYKDGIRQQIHKKKDENIQYFEVGYPKVIEK